MQAGGSWHRSMLHTGKVQVLLREVSSNSAKNKKSKLEFEVAQEPWCAVWHQQN